MTFHKVSLADIMLEPQKINPWSRKAEQGLTPDNKSMVQTESICRRQIKFGWKFENLNSCTLEELPDNKSFYQKIAFFLENVESIVGKGENSGYPKKFNFSIINFILLSANSSILTSPTFYSLD